MDDRWTEENPSDNVFYPRLSYGANNNDSRPSTWWLKDGNYLRLKNFEVGYSPALGKKISKAVSNMRIYFRATNLLTFSSFRLWDPELVGEGYRQYPLSRTMSVGIDFTFN